MFGFSYPGQTYPAGFPFIETGEAPDVHYMASIENVARVPRQRRRLSMPQQERRAAVPAQRRRARVDD